MKRELRYHVVDVFTSVPLEGNPLAVFPDAHGLAPELMLRIARELNLSETTFVLPPERGGDLRVRIFTPRAEMAFAGHPTIGTAFVARRLGLVAPAAGSLVLEEPIGNVPVQADDGPDPMLWLTTPPIEEGPEFDEEPCVAALGLQVDDLLPGIRPRVLSAGNPCLFVALRDRATVDRIAIDSVALRRLSAGRSVPLCLFAFTPAPEGAYSRMFAEEFGVTEDPATGSATGPLAAFMIAHDLAPAADGATFVSEQGTKMGRRSLLHVRLRGERGRTAIEVGGHTVPVAEAAMLLDVE